MSFWSFVAYGIGQKFKSHVNGDFWPSKERLEYKFQGSNNKIFTSSDSSVDF